MMNKSLLGCGRESSHKDFYGFHELRSLDNRQASARFRVRSPRQSVFERKPPPDMDSGVDTGLREENASNKKLAREKAKKSRRFRRLLK